ncbi:MAG TPA: hypothetical protein VFF28_01075 [Candidatus Nanoarchaeia archaeon]|nr:hypothetical protein [Candidatus Nanoarchaeia archaeon]
MGYRADYLTNIEELEQEIERHKSTESILEEKDTDNPQITLNFDRAKNEL